MQYSDKDIIYFVMSHAHLDKDGRPSYVRPVPPDSAMGEEFCSRIARWLNLVDLWIEQNPDQYQHAIRGSYKP